MINKVFLVGNLGKDPVVKEGKKNKRGSFQLGTTESWKDREGEWQSKTIWNTIVVWGKLCDTIETLEKGQQVLIEGKIGTRTYEERQITEITASIVIPFPKKTVEKAAEKEKAKEDIDDFDDEMPF